MKKEFAVIGLGSFGSSVCKELFNYGHEVLVIDNKEEKIQLAHDFSTHAVIANATDETALRSVGIRNFDHVILAIGNDIESSILSTLILKEIGVDIIWVRAKNDYHRKVLEKLGATGIIHPERDIGIHLAHHFLTERVLDYIELSVDYSIVEFIATRKINNKTLKELNIRTEYSCTVLALKREENLNISPDPEDKVEEGDILVILGNNIDLERFEATGM